MGRSVPLLALAAWLVASGLVPILAPATAQALPGLGHPEWYANNKVQLGGKSSAVPYFTFGQVHLESAQIGSEGFECVTMGFGSVWNEGSGEQRRAVGQFLTWNGGGHVPEGVHLQLAASCRPPSATAPPAFWTDESPLRSEQNGQGEEEPALRDRSTPWNAELDCGIREESFQGILRIGVPDAQFPRPPSTTDCPDEATEEEESNEIAAYKKEREEKQGCYASIPAPEGCIRTTIVEPGAALEVSFGGTLHAKLINGVRNGLTASKLKLEGPTSGELQCEAPVGCVATGKEFGEAKVEGFTELQLLTSR